MFVLKMIAKVKKNCLFVKRILAQCFDKNAIALSLSKNKNLIAKHPLLFISKNLCLQTHSQVTLSQLMAVDSQSFCVNIYEISPANGKWFKNPLKCLMFLIASD